MRVILNSDFFDTLHPFQYVWPTLVHAGVETVATWAAPVGSNYRSLRMEYDLCENTAIETFRVTDLTGRHIYIQDTRALPCASSSPESIRNIMECLKVGWGLGGGEDSDIAMAQTAFNQCHSWFKGWMKSWLEKQAKVVMEQTAPVSFDLCKRMLKEAH